MSVTPSDLFYNSGSLKGRILTRLFGSPGTRWQDRLRPWLIAELRRDALVRSLSAGFMLYVLAVIMNISFSALIFKGELAAQLPIVLPFVLAGNSVLILIVALLSSYSGSIASAQDAPAVITALAAATLVSALPASASQGEIIATVLVLVLGSSIVVGLAFLLFGLFRLGSFVRYLPYPVMGGFLAGTGWLLAFGGVGVMQDLSIGSGIFASDRLLFWIPGLAAGVLMAAGMRKWRSPVILLAGLAALVLLFYGALVVFRLPFAEVSAAGWLLGPFPELEGWNIPLSPARLSQVNWPALSAALPEALPALFLGMIALLLNASGLELVIKKDFDLNRELVTAGIANLLGGFTGSLMGYHSVSLTTLNHTITRGRRLPGLIVPLLMVMTVMFGTDLLAYLPRMMLGALLVYIGASLLYEWVVEVWAKFPKIDAAIVMTILATIIWKDFLWGIGIGTALTIILFLISYSRVNVVRHVLSGSNYQSRMHRSIEHARLLKFHGEEVCIFKLEGFIFFGTANELYEQVNERMKTAGKRPIRFLILDFDMVTGLDTTGLLSFEKMLQYTRSQETNLILSGLKSRSLSQFTRGGFKDGDEKLRIFPSLDRAVEWCETQMIMESSFEISSAKSLLERLVRVLPEEENLQALLGFMERREYRKGEYLMRAGDPAGEILFIETGQVTVQLEQEDGSPLRLETAGGGRVVGEVGFYLDRPRTADVIADEDTGVYALKRETLERIRIEDPNVLYTLSRLVVNQTSERIVAMTRALDALED